MVNGVILRLYLSVVIAVCIALIPLVWFSPFTLLQTYLLAAVSLFIALWLTYLSSRSLRRGLSALEIGLQNFKDGEFSTLLSYQGNNEVAQLCELYNQTANKLRKEKHWLYQRELMLDKVLQSTPEVLFLVNNQQQVVFSNWAARDYFDCVDSLEGKNLTDLCAELPEGAKTAVMEARQGIFGVAEPQQEVQNWYLSTGVFVLNGQPHTLYLLKQMTRELNRQEVAVWKKVIRIISHELNNSLGPISSMLHSGKIISTQTNDQRLSRVFNTIDGRIQHLVQFVQGYGKFAKLPEPKISQIDWNALLQQLNQQWQFSEVDPQPNATVKADPVLLEQLLINLLKNAHESGSDPEQVSISLRCIAQQQIIEVTDAGPGMTDAVLANALIPFYSTKASGSGLGLALCREIVEGHNGYIGLHNRTEGGLCVRISLPG